MTLSGPPPPDGTLANPVEYIKEYVTSKKIGALWSETKSISSNPEILECSLSVNGLKASGLGRTKEEAESSAYLSLFNSIKAKEKEAILSPTLPIDPSKPWFDQPRNYLYALATKFKKAVSIDAKAVANVFTVKLVFDEELGLVATGQGPNKKEATHQAALYLCFLFDDYVEKHGPPFKNIPEYEKFLTHDLPNRSEYHWYSKVRDWVAKFASLFFKKAAVYEVLPAPLDADTFLCTLTIDEVKGIVGYGRASTEKEAARLAAVDLCSRIDHMSSFTSSTPSLSSPGISKSPSFEKTALSVALDHEINAAKLASIQIESPGKNDVAVPDTASKDKAVPALKKAKATPTAASVKETTLSSTTKSNNPFIEPIMITTPVAKVATKNVLDASLTASPPEKPITDVARKGPETAEKISFPTTKFQLDHKLLQLFETWRREYDLQNFSCFTQAVFYDKIGWNCRFNARMASGRLIEASNPTRCSKKANAVASAFLAFMEKVDETFGIGHFANSSYLSKKSVAGDAPCSAQTNPIKQEASRSAVRAEKPSQGTNPEATPLQTRADATNLSISYPEIVVSSLTKWFANPKNFNRVKAISKFLDSPASTPAKALTLPITNVSAALLEKKSAELLHDLMKSQNNSELLHYRSSLPIFPYREEIINAINGHQVVLLSAENGYGKSTQVPNYILEHMTLDNVGAQCNVIVVSSNTLAARTVAKGIAEERGEQIGQRVFFEGDRIEDRKRFGSITFCTGELFLDHLQSNSELYGFSHVVIDNADDGTLTTEFTLLAIKKLLERRPELRLVLLTSLIEVKGFQDFFCMRSFFACVMVPYETSIQQFFLEDYTGQLDKALVSSKDSDEFVKEEFRYGETVARDSSPLRKSLSTDHMPYSLIEAILGQLCRSTAQHESILIFLPSGEEISTLHRFLVEDDILKVGYSNETFFQFIFIHPNVRNLDDVYQMDYRAALPLRKIFLCTAEAESTFPTTAVVHVIDTCKYKPKLIEASAGEDLGVYRWISQVECVRRSRCAGRLSCIGSYYSLMSLQRFTHLDPEALPEIQRYSPQYCILRAKQMLPAFLVEDLAKELFHRLPEKVSAQALVEELKTLKAMAPIDELTLTGMLLSRLPLPVHLSKMILFGMVFRCLDSALVMAAAAMTGSPFLTPRPGEEINPYLAFKSDSSSDQVCVLETFNAWWSLKSKSPSRSAELEFCSANKLSYPVLVKMAQTRQLMMAALLDSGLVAAMGRLFNRFIESPESKDVLMNFLNENSGKMKLNQAVALFGLYPSLAVAHADSWRSVRYGKEGLRVHSSTGCGRGIETAGQKDIVFAFGRTIDTQPAASITDVTRASPLALLLFFSPSSTHTRLGDSDADFYSPTHAILVNRSIQFQFPEGQAATLISSKLKACFNLSIQWLFTRLAHASLGHALKDFTEEELVRYVDNVIRTIISLLESEKY